MIGGKLASDCRKWYLHTLKNSLECDALALKLLVQHIKINPHISVKRALLDESKYMLKIRYEGFSELTVKTL